MKRSRDEEKRLLMARLAKLTATLNTHAAKKSKTVPLQRPHVGFKVPVEDPIEKAFLEGGNVPLETKPAPVKLPQPVPESKVPPPIALEIAPPEPVVMISSSDPSDPVTQTNLQTLEPILITETGDVLNPEQLSLSTVEAKFDDEEISEAYFDVFPGVDVVAEKDIEIKPGSQQAVGFDYSAKDHMEAPLVKDKKRPEPCVNWPQCKFGSKCLFDHPVMPCAYKSSCSRPNCNYSHDTAELLAAAKSSPKEIRLLDVGAYLKAYRKAIKLSDLLEALKKRTLFTKKFTQQALLTVIGFPPSPAFLQSLSSQPDATQCSSAEFIAQSKMAFKISKREGAFWVQYVDPNSIQVDRSSASTSNESGIPVSSSFQSQIEISQAPDALISDDTFLPWEAPKNERPFQILFVDENSLEYLGHSDPSKFLRPLSKKGPDQNSKRIVVTPPITNGKGFDMLSRMGWRIGEGLGKRRQGLVEPVPIWFMTDRAGIFVSSER